MSAIRLTIGGDHPREVAAFFEAFKLIFSQHFQDLSGLAYVIESPKRLQKDLDKCNAHLERAGFESWDDPNIDSLLIDLRNVVLQREMPVINQLGWTIEQYLEYLSDMTIENVEINL